MRFLKVCLTGDTPLNCGTCEKCLRTMAGLFVSGALDLCATFEQPLRFERLASSRLGNPGAREFVEQLVLSMGDSPDERRLKQCLEASLGSDPQLDAREVGSQSPFPAGQGLPARSAAAFLPLVASGGSRTRRSEPPSIVRERGVDGGSP